MKGEGREGRGERRERGAEVKQNERKKGGEGKTGNIMGDERVVMGDKWSMYSRMRG